MISQVTLALCFPLFNTEFTELAIAVLLISALSLLTMVVKLDLTVKSLSFSKNLTLGLLFGFDGILAC